MWLETSISWQCLDFGSPSYTKRTSWSEICPVQIEIPCPDSSPSSLSSVRSDHLQSPQSNSELHTLRRLLMHIRKSKGINQGGEMGHWRTMQATLKLVIYFTPNFHTKLQWISYSQIFTDRGISQRLSKNGTKTEAYFDVLWLVFCFERQESQKDLLFTGWFPQVPATTARVGQGETRKWKRHPGLLCGWQGPNYLSHYLLTPRTQESKGIRIQVLVRRYGIWHHKGCPNWCAKHLSQISLFLGKKKIFKSMHSSFITHIFNEFFKEQFYILNCLLGINSERLLVQRK